MTSSTRTLARWALASLTGAVALGVLLLAAPRIQASLLYLPVDTAIDRYFRERAAAPDGQHSLTSVQLDALRARARSAIEASPHYRYYDGLSLLNYLQAIDRTGKPWLQRPALVRAEQAALAAAQRAPAKPTTWLRVAQARAALGQEAAAIAEPLSLSILAGRVEPTLLLPRLELGYRYLGQLDEETLNLLRDQTLLAWRVDERAFRRALADERLSLSQVEYVLGSKNAAIVRAMEPDR